MKYALVSAVILTIAAGTANAQMSFETGKIDFNYYGYEGSPGVSTFILGGRGAYSLGQMGLQFDASALSIGDSISSIQEYSTGIHLYKQLASGSKIGGYAGANAFSISGSGSIFSAGAEGIASFGALDVEAAIGVFAISTATSNYWSADIDAYYALTPAIELNAGTLILMSGGGSASIYNLGASYTLPGIPLSIGATYLTSAGLNVYSINASFSFGPKPKERLFNSRIFPLYMGL